LDLREFTALKFVELAFCHNLDTLKLGSNPVLERLLVIDCDLDSLDISGCPALKELRGALNDLTSINWGSIGQSLWHICIRDNPQIIDNIPALTQFPVLSELFVQNTNQTGAFVCHSSAILLILASYNHYTSADISDCPRLQMLLLSGNPLNSLNIGTANNLIQVDLKDCGLTESQTDYVLQTLDEAGLSNGYLELTGNAAPSAEGLVNSDSLKGRGWTIFTEYPIDCNGDENGLAFVDSCGVCAGGNTGITPILDKDGCSSPFKIFPNPNDGLLNIVCIEPLPFQIMIIDLVGKVVLEDNFYGNITIDTSDLMIGYYEVFIIIRNEIIIRQKLIIL
jgi:hypothetical protein